MAVKKSTSRTTKVTKPEEISPGPPPAETLPKEIPSFEEVATRVREQAAETPAKKAVREKREQEVLEAAASATPEEVVEGLGRVRLAVHAAFDNLENALLEQAKRLATLEEAVRLRRAELSEFYRIEVAAHTLEELVAYYEAEKGRIERELSEARAQAEAERRRFGAAFDEEKAQAQKAWKREQEEYEYRKKTLREREEAEYQAKRQALLSAMAEERARQEQESKAREEALAAREGRLAELEACVQAFPEELGQAAERAREEGAAGERERARHAAELVAKEAEATGGLLRQRVATLEEQNKALAARIAELERELREATDRVRDIALKAIEGASGAAALHRVSEIALQQARGRGEG